MALYVAKQDPNLTAHVYQVETMARQLAERRRIARQHCRHSATHRVFDFVTVRQIEMAHGITYWAVVFDDVAGAYIGHWPRVTSLMKIAPNAMRLFFVKLRASAQPMAPAGASKTANVSMHSVNSRHLQSGRRLTSVGLSPRALRLRQPVGRHGSGFSRKAERNRLRIVAAKAVASSAAPGGGRASQRRRDRQFPARRVLCMRSA